MSSPTSLSGVIRQLPSHGGEPLPDAELLACYARHRDEAAFAAVVRRYGGLVLGVARRLLADRLAARGLAPSVMVLAAVAVPAELLARTAPLAAAPWSKAVPPAVAALAATAAPRRLLPAVACSLVVVGLAGWVIALGGN